MRIGFGLDGVLYDFHGVVYDWFSVFRNYTGTIPELFGTKQETISWLSNVPHIYTIRSPDGLDVLYYLNSRGVEIFYITSRPSSVHFATWQYMMRYKFPQVNNLIFSKEKWRVVSKLCLDIFVDDFPAVLSNIVPPTRPILKLASWNTNRDSGFVSISDLSAIKEFV